MLEHVQNKAIKEDKNQDRTVSGFSLDNLSQLRKMTGGISYPVGRAGPLAHQRSRGFKGIKHKASTSQYLHPSTVRPPRAHLNAI